MFSAASNAMIFATLFFATDGVLMNFVSARCPGNGHRARPGEAVPRRDGAERLGDLHRPAALVRRVGRVRLERELLQHEPAGRAGRENTARDMPGSDVNG